MTLAPKPIDPGLLRAEMIFSSPLNAPPHTNRMLVVSTPARCAAKLTTTRG